jgi:hypothetical protein
MMSWHAVWFYFSVFAIASIVGFPLWRLSEAIVFRFTKSDDHPVMRDFVFILLCGLLTAMWGLTHASMFNDVNSQSTATEMLFMALGGLTVLFIMSLFGSAVLAVFDRLLGVIRGKPDSP